MSMPPQSSGHDAPTNAQPASGPHADPCCIQTDRSVLARWDAGKPDAEGFQPQAELQVLHLRARGYKAFVHNVRTREDAMVTVTKVDLALTAPRPVILEREAQRFNRSALNKVFREALTELRRRYSQGDPEIAPFFAPKADPLQ